MCFSARRNLIFFFSDSDRYQIDTCRQNEFAFAVMVQLLRFFQVRSNLSSNKSLGSLRKNLLRLFGRNSAT